MEAIESLFAIVDNIDSDVSEVLHDVENSMVINIQRVYLRDVDPFCDFSEDSFRKRFRFTKSVVKNVISPLVINYLRLDTQRGLPITPELQLLLTLRFYATRSFQIVCGDIMHISQSTVCTIIRRVSRALALQMPNYVKFPVDLRKTKEEFEKLGRIGRMPGLKNIVGAVDCTHIRISKPRGISHTEQYRNRKGYFSLNCQVVGGPDLKMYDIVVRWAGSTHDSRIYRNSRLNLKMQNDIDGVLVADADYPCTRHLLTPVSNPSTLAEERFNKAQIKTRNSVERLFGVWKRRFPCLQKGLGTKLSTTANIIIACAVLHNISIECNDTDCEDYEDPSNHNDSVLNFRNVSSTNDGMVLRANIIARDFT